MPMLKTKRSSPGQYGETKKLRSVKVTDTAWDGWQRKADYLGINRNDLIERVGRSLAFAAIVSSLLAIDRLLGSDENPANGDRP